MPSLAVACAQIECRPWSTEANRANAETQVNRAASQGARLVVLPEYLTTGCLYDRRLKELAEPVGGPTTIWMTQLSRTTGCWIAGGIVEKEGRRVYNSILMTDPGGESHVYRKRYLAFFENL